MTDVREALHSLTEGVPPPDLTDRVVAGARHRRRRSMLATAAVSVAAVAAVTLPVTMTRHDGSPAERRTYPNTGTSVPPPIGTATQPTGSARPPRPGGGPVVLDAFVISGDPALATSKLLNRATGAYVTLPFSSIRLSPDGNTLAVGSRASGMYDPRQQVGVVSRADALAGRTDRVRWLGVGHEPVWSPDGTKLLVDTTPPTQVDPSPRIDGTLVPRRLAVFQVGGWQRSDLTLQLDIAGHWLQFGWAADSAHLLIPLWSDRSTPEHTVGGDMQYVNLDGTLGQRVPVTGGVIGGEAYSPSRQRVIVSGVWAADRVVDSAWHTVLTSSGGGSQFVGWYDDQHVIEVVWARADSGDTPYLKVVDMSGHVLKQIPMPGNTYLDVMFRSSAGLTGAAAQLGF